MVESKITLEFTYNWIILFDRYVIPPAAILVIVTNVLVVLVYCRKYRRLGSEIRKIASILYIAIAIANILAVLPKSALYLYSFSFEHVTHFIPFELCWTWTFLTKLTIIPHLASIWFVTILSLQRFMVIRYPFTHGQLWNLRKTLIAIVSVVIILVILKLPFFFGYKITPIEINNQTYLSVTSDMSCEIEYADWRQNNGDVIELILLGFRLLAVLLSSAVIVFCDFSLIAYLQSSTKIHNILLKVISSSIGSGNELLKKKNKRKKALSKTNHQVRLIITLSFIVFIVEIPYALILSMYIYFTVVKFYQPLECYWIGLSNTIFDFSIVMTYPSLFILSCIMSQRFRRHLCSLCRKV